jgi:hypothetical protein
MKLPIQAYPVLRNVSSSKNNGDGIIPSDDCGDCMLKMGSCIPSAGLGGMTYVACMAIAEQTEACISCDARRGGRPPRRPIQ